MHYRPVFRHRPRQRAGLSNTNSVTLRDARLANIPMDPLHLEHRVAEASGHGTKTNLDPQRLEDTPQEYVPTSVRDMPKHC